MKENFIVGAISFVVIQIVLTPFAFPPYPAIKVAAGFACMRRFDSTGKAVVVGSLMVLIGSFIGSLIAFYISRLVLKKTLLTKLKQRRMVKVLQDAIKNEGLKVLFLVRMTPIIPYGVLNYLMGMTDIKVLHYIAGSFGLVPGIVT